MRCGLSATAPRYHNPTARHLRTVGAECSARRKVVAQNIVRTVGGEGQRPFTYTPIGELALVGRHKGVARVYGLNFSGVTVYLLWRGVYIRRCRPLRSDCECWAIGASMCFLARPRNTSCHLRICS
ncbi:MAG: FAD-dependent pyridine nucleotide-disulfide oxidoreductase [Bryobacterales bacterium]|nr:FAD-dependent pyridine nucleotide-disulfide oxidoreductase [Bryobacterales bacterium]